MDDEMSARIDAKFQRIFDKVDEVRDKLTKQRDYSRNTALIVLVLWGVGLPLTFMVSINIAARMALR